MGRPRTFDEIAAIEAAAAVFRQHGYAATSIDDLVAATGIHRGSLYNVFGSKHGLLARVLDAATDTADDAARLDVLLVALLEVAPGDERIAAQIAATLREHGTTAEELGARLIARAGLVTTKGES